MHNADKLNLKTRFVNIITARIFSGELNPGDRLPPERVLAKELGISRGSINQGILDLERMGLLRIAPRKGNFVADYLDNPTTDTLSAIMGFDSGLVYADLFMDLMGLRILIERECTRLACGRINKKATGLLSELTARIYAAEGDALIDAIYGYHQYIVQLSGNAAYLMVFRSFEKVIRNLISAHYTNRDELKKCLPLYDELTAAISRGSSVQADELITKLLGYGTDYLNVTLVRREAPRQ